MPNHVTNIVTYEGDRKQIAEMLEAIKNDELGIGTVDFQKIIPMPDDIYTGNLGPKEREIYGDKNWYDWRRANWGTKWGAYGYEEDFDYSQTDSLWFQTAWSAPHPILQKLTEMFPEIEFKHQWADEDIGYNCGQHRYHGGERTDEFYPESEFDRIRFAAEVLEVDPQEYGLFLNETNTAFIQVPDEDFELIEVAGQTALFTDNRYNDETVPMGLHCYQLRHSDYGANFISLERRVGVNFGGTVITKECIDLGREQCIEFDEETEPNFLGERCQMEDFIAGNYGQEEEMEMEVNPV